MNPLLGLNEFSNEYLLKLSLIMQLNFTSTGATKHLLLKPMWTTRPDHVLPKTAV